MMTIVLNGQYVSAMMQNFRASAYNDVFGNIRKTLETRELGRKHFDQIKAALDAMKQAAVEKIYVMPGEKTSDRVVAGLSYLEPDPDEPSMRTGFAFLTDIGRHYIILAERPIPFELDLPNIQKTSAKTGSDGIEFQSLPLDLAASMSFLMAQTMTEQMPEDENSFPVALPYKSGPHVTGLFTGRAERVEKGSYLPIRYIYYSRGQDASIINTFQNMTFEEPEFIVSLNRFVGENAQTPAEREISAMYNVMLGSDNMQEKVQLSFVSFLEGGRARQLAAYEFAGRNTDTIRKEHMANEIAKEQLVAIMTSSAWYQFAKEENRYTKRQDSALAEPPPGYEAA